MRQALFAVALWLLPALASAADANLTASAPGGQPAKKKRVSFMGLTAQSGVSEALARELSSTVTTALAETGVYDVMSNQDIERILGMERQRQLLGCSDDGQQSCLAEIAGALNSDRLISGTVQRVDDTYNISLSLTDPKTVRVIGRANRKVDSPGGLGLVNDALESAAYELVNQDPMLNGRTVKPERGFGGLVLGVRGDVDVLGFGGPVRDLPLSPGIFVEYAWKRFGVALTLIPKVDFGGRVEARLHPFAVRNLLRPHLALGTTVFRSGASARGALGATVKLGQAQVALDAGYEYFAAFSQPQLFNAHSVMVGLSAGWGL